MADLPLFLVSSSESVNCVLKTGHIIERFQDQLILFPLSISKSFCKQEIKIS